MTKIPVFQMSHHLRLSAKICVPLFPINKMKTKIFSLIAACTILLSASPSFGLQATFTPGISISEEYTDNYHRTDKDKEYEYTTIISPSFTAQIPGKTRGVKISYKPSYVIYDKFDENNTWRHSASFSGWAEIAKNFRLNAGNSYVYTEEPDVEIEEIIIKDTTIRKGRNPYHTNSAGLNLIGQFGESDSFNLGYLHSILENKDPDIEDNERHNPSIAITYWFIPRQLGLETNISYTKGELEISDDFDNWKGSARLIKSFTRHFKGFVQYTHAYMDYQGDSENYQIYDPSIGIDYKINQNTHLSFSVGYFYQDREESENESGISINGDLGKSWTFKRGSINLTGSSGYNEAYFGAENLGFDIFYQAQCNASYGFTKHISGDISGSYRNDKYVNLDTERKDNTAEAGMGLTFQPLPWMTIGLNYTYRSVDSTLNENNYVENRGLISITLFPSRPFRKTF